MNSDIFCYINGPMSKMTLTSRFMQMQTHQQVMFVNYILNCYYSNSLACKINSWYFLCNYNPMRHTGCMFTIFPTQLYKTSSKTTCQYTCKVSLTPNMLSTINILGITQCVAIKYLLTSNFPGNYHPKCNHVVLQCFLHTCIKLVLIIHVNILHQPSTVSMLHIDHNMCL